MEWLIGWSFGRDQLVKHVVPRSIDISFDCPLVNLIHFYCLILRRWCCFYTQCWRWRLVALSLFLLGVKDNGGFWIPVSSRALRSCSQTSFGTISRPHCRPEAVRVAFSKSKGPSRKVLASVRLRKSDQAMYLVGSGSFCGANSRRTSEYSRTPSGAVEYSRHSMHQWAWLQGSLESLETQTRKST